MAYYNTSLFRVIKRCTLIQVCLLLCVIQSFGQRTDIPAKANEYGVIANTLDTSSILQLLDEGKKIIIYSPDSANILFRQALSSSQLAGYNYGIAYSYLLIGNYYLDKAVYDSSLMMLKNAAMFSNDLNDRKRMAIRISNAIGNNYFFKGNYPLASYYYYNSLKLTNTNGAYHKAMIYNNIACVWMDMKEKNLALSYLKKAEAAAIQEKNEGALSRVYSHLGNAYTQLYNDSTTAYKYYMQALALARKTNTVDVEQMTLVNIGNLYVAEAKYKDAINYFHQAENIPAYMSLRTAISMQYSYSIAAFDIKDYKESEKQVDLLYENARQSNLNDYIAKAYYVRSLLYAATSRQQAAYDALKHYVAMNDTLTNNERDKTIRELDTKYHSLEKDTRLVQQQLLLTRQQYNLHTKNFWIVAVSLLSLLCAVALFLLYRNDKHKQNLQAAAIQELKKNQEIKELKAQIAGEEKERNRLARELHDGVVSQLLATKLNLNLIRNRAIIHPNDLTEPLNQIDDAAKETRRMAHNLTSDIFSQRSFEDIVSGYFEKIKKSSGLKIEFQQCGLIPHLNAEVKLSLYRILQELTQNTLKHAHASELLVQLTYRGELLSITFEDNGIGFSKGGNTITAGVGLCGIESRVRSLNGKMDISSDAGAGASIYLEFDMHTS